jgi:hypothetical protein
MIARTDYYSKYIAPPYSKPVLFSKRQYMQSEKTLFSVKKIEPPSLAPLSTNLQFKQPFKTDLLVRDIAPPLPPVADCLTSLLIKLQSMQFNNELSVK